MPPFSTGSRARGPGSSQRCPRPGAAPLPCPGLDPGRCSVRLAAGRRDSQSKIESLFCSLLHLQRICSKISSQGRTTAPRAPRSRSRRATCGRLRRTLVCNKIWSILWLIEIELDLAGASGLATKILLRRAWCGFPLRRALFGRTHGRPGERDLYRPSLHVFARTHNAAASRERLPQVGPPGRAG
jgi:hypothetical protein